MSLDRKTMVANAYLLRSELLSQLLDENKDIDYECGYPTTISTDQYRYLYDREGLAKRIVTLYPQESWALHPTLYEIEEPEQTEFERAWDSLLAKRNLWHYLSRVDELSGIGRYGILLLGLADGKDLSSPVDGINERGEKVGDAKTELMYLRAFDEDVVTVDTRESDMRNPRYGQPTMYTVTFETLEGQIQGDQSAKVHWSRVIHVADNRETSEVYGVPRLQALYNRVYDVRKIVSGSGEMYWKGAFPGFAFEVAPDQSLSDDDKTSLREEFANYANGLQRYLALVGVSVKSLSPQVADPLKHLEAQLQIVALTLCVPLRILLGSEEARLASSQDIRTWNKRLARRQEEYITPMIIRPFVDRLIAVGALPEPVEDYQVSWPDLNASTDQEQAQVLDMVTRAFANYVKGGVDQIIPPAEYLTMLAGMDPQEVETVMQAAQDHVQGPADVSFEPQGQDEPAREE